MAQHLEAGAAAPEHDRGLQHDGRHAAGEQDPPDLLAAAQVRRQLLALGRQPAQVDDPPDAGVRARRRRTCAAAGAVGVLELGARADRVHEVVRDVDAGQRRPEALGIGDVADDDLDVVDPRRVAQP